ncbi:MAG: hypothetical protein U0441_21290 [Polyangiaceae bacterium]
MSQLRARVQVLSAWVIGGALAAGCGSDPGSSGKGGGGGTTSQGGTTTTTSSGGTTTTGGGGATTTTTGGGGATGGTGGVGGSGGTGGSGGAPHIPVCVESCQTAADCVHAGEVFSADNYECVGGKCNYLGCLTDKECLDTYGTGTIVCVSGNPGTVPACVEACQTSADCAQAGQVYSAAHWDCAAGRCKYLGCNTDQECMNTFGTGTIVCLSDSGVGIPVCVEPCQTSADCVHAGEVFSADNYECAAGRCKYTGCNTDKECSDTFGATTDVCL